MNSLLVVLHINELDIICLYTVKYCYYLLAVKWVNVLPSHTYNSVQL